MSTLQLRTAVISQAVESLKTRTAFQAAFFDVWNDLKWYLKRAAPRKETVVEYARTWSLVLSPFVPFVAEELSEKLGRKGLASLGRWPEPEGRPVDAGALLGEWDVEHAIDDIKGILAVVKQQPTRASVYVASSERLQLFRKIAGSLLKGKKDGDIIKEGLSSAAPADRQATVSLIQSIVKLCRGLGDEVLGRLHDADAFDEWNVLREAAPFIASETGLRAVEVIKELPPAAPGRKALNPLPLKPSIVLE